METKNIPSNLLKPVEKLEDQLYKLIDANAKIPLDLVKEWNALMHKVDEKNAELNKDLKATDAALGLKEQHHE